MTSTTRSGGWSVPMVVTDGEYTDHVVTLAQTEDGRTLVLVDGLWRDFDDSNWLHRAAIAQIARTETTER